MEYFILSITSAVFLFSSVFWFRRVQDAVRTFLKVPEIDPWDKVRLGSEPPLISVVVPAHNEEAGIKACLRSVLEQDYPNFELILVDDRSDDRTAATAQSMAVGKKHFRVVSVKELPPGWTGKCNALDAGVRSARGSWLAFLDADSILHPSALRQSYHRAVANDVSMVTLSPKLDLQTFWEKALQPVFMGMSSILYPLDRINDPSSPVASANGMFWIIRREAYEKIGGHREVRNLAVEDIGIGKRVKAGGLGLLFLNGRKVLSTRMYTNLSEILMGWTRILSASMNYELPRVVGHLFAHLLISLPVVLTALIFYTPIAAEVWPRIWFVLPSISFIEVGIVSYFFYDLLGVSRKYSLLLFLGNFMLVGVLALIVKKILWNDALQWRGTTYASSRYQPKNLDPVPSEACNSALPPVLSGR